MIISLFIQKTEPIMSLQNGDHIKLTDGLGDTHELAIESTRTVTWCAMAKHKSGHCEVLAGNEDDLQSQIAKVLTCFSDL